MPISSRTIKCLSAAKLTIATDIQLAVIPHALAGRDILAAAKTGSGKTLAFVIPLIEKLYLEKWSLEDGLAGLIITPTRELALQIFEVIRIVGAKHQLSAGLVTGGKKEFEGEQERIVKMNILVATPGRLLQHFEQTSGFDASQLLVLVLDEADRILDLGFKKQLDAIVGYIPQQRQTMLFSATQTKSVKDLARLSLKNPEYLAVHAEDSEVTPKQLVQHYIVCELPEKLDILYSFIKSHLKSKIIVFFSTCCQVRFTYDCFSSMQPGIALTALHGKIKQERRTIIYMDFIKRNASCLFATDIAARGLDFPNVDWVVQVDAPEDAAMYIHRVGRTARYNSTGKALLMLTPNEEAVVAGNLIQHNIPIKKLKVNPKKTFSIAAKAAELLISQPNFKILAKKAFCGYIRSIHLLPDVSKLNLKNLPLEEFAASLGLPFAPELPKFVATGTKKDNDENEAEEGGGEAIGREEVREKKNINRFFF
jgi:ATP-dependent RNA helicase DDX10/DBP4